MMLVRGRPISSARAADSSADWTMASRVTSRGVDRVGDSRVLVHQWVSSSWSSEPQLAPMRTALPCLIAISTMALNCRSRLFLEADIAGIDAVFVERLGAGRMIGQQLVADIVEIADQRHVDAHSSCSKALADVRHGGRGLVAVDRDADDLRAGARQRRDLPLRRALASAVSVLVIDCTTIGAPPPTVTLPTLTATV
jgi:hypothetical protein